VAPDLLLCPRIQRVVDRQLELELALVIDTEVHEAARDRFEAC
jgi:hypothetical protein